MTIKRLHHNLIEATISALDQIFNRSHYADKVVEQILKSNRKWGSRDRRFIAEAVYDCVRWKRLYVYAVEVNAPYSKQDLSLILAVYLSLNDYEIPELDIFNDFDITKVNQRLQQAEYIRTIRESIPDWLDVLGEKAFKHQWEQELEALNTQAKVVIRVNTLKTTRENLKQALQQEGIETIALTDYPDALVLVKRQNLAHTKPYKNGWFEIQDASSQLVAPFLNVTSGDYVIDACAGGGGKSLHLATLMQNQGNILAIDIYLSKLNNLNKRAKRNGVDIIETMLVKDYDVLRPFNQKADKVLIDAPCSGLGVLRRNPDAKWKLDLDFIKDLEHSQLEILEQYASLAKVGGEVVYATCSILPAENEIIVNKFLQSNKAFTFVKDLKVSPAQSGYDGFYMALLKRES